MTTLRILEPVPRVTPLTDPVVLPRGSVEPSAPARHRAALPPRHLADLDLAGRRALGVSLGEPAMRASQLSHHYFGRLVRDPAAMTDIPLAARERLVDGMMPQLLTAVRELECDGGATRKSVWRLHDGSLVESVLMAYSDRVTACVSSQAGCGMACPFCATGQAGLTRNLSTAEIVDQVVWLAGVAVRGLGPEVPARLSHVVFMGMGEPLANYARVVEAVRRLIAPPPEGLEARTMALAEQIASHAPITIQVTKEAIRRILESRRVAAQDDLVVKAYMSKDFAEGVRAFLEKRKPVWTGQ